MTHSLINSRDDVEHKRISFVKISNTLAMQGNCFDETMSFNKLKYATTATTAADVTVKKPLI